jgi:hypothetical protein
MAQIALKRSDQVVPVSSLQKPHLVANQSLINAIVINWRLSWKDN